MSEALWTVVGKWNPKVKEIRGNAKVGCVVLLNKTKETRGMGVDDAFIQIGEVPNSHIAREAGLAVDEKGYTIVDQRQKTSVEGVYTTGDVTACPVKQIGTAVGQASIAATEAFGYVKRPYWRR